MSNAPTIITAGEILVEFVSHQRNCGLESVTEYSGPYPSGAPAIFLNQAARMGAKTEMIGCVGNDGFGKSVLARLNADGVGTTGITLNDDLSTGVAFVSYYDSGERDFIFHITNTAADHFETPEDLPDLSDVWLHVSAASLGNERMRDVIMDLVAQVSAAGGKIVCDPNARPELMKDAAVNAALSNVIAQSYCLMPSTSDLGFLFPDDAEDAAIEKMLSARAEIIALKRGADGVTLVNHGNRYDIPGHSVVEVDPTGAGDCFCGTLIALLSQGISLREAGELANAAGAIAVTRRGPMEGNSSASEIAALLESSNPKEHTS